MPPQSRQMLCYLAYKVIPCCNSKKITAVLTTVKRNNHYSCILRSTCRSTMQMSENISKIYSYPTHFLCYRTTCIRGIKLKNDTSHKAGDKLSEKDENKPFGKLTVQYCLKYLYAWILDRDVQFHIGRSFLEGTIGAFLFISDCLAEKNYDGLAQVVTPKLLERIKNRDQMIRSDKSSSDVFIAKDLKLITLVDMNWSIDRSTKIKTLEVLIRLVHCKEQVTLDTFQQMREISRKGSLQGVPASMANMTLLRTYGENMQDSPWVVTDLFYYSVEERWKFYRRNV